MFLSKKTKLGLNVSVLATIAIACAGLLAGTQGVLAVVRNLEARHAGLHEAVNERGELIRVKRAAGEQKPKARNYACDIPYRAFLPRKINNLLLAGECLSCTHDWFYGYRLIPWCMRTGEVAATAAVMAIRQGITPKDIKWTSGYFED